jgi:hypothetical protein
MFDLHTLSTIHEIERRTAGDDRRRAPRRWSLLGLVRRRPTPLPPVTAMPAPAVQPADDARPSAA